MRKYCAMTVGLVASLGLSACENTLSWRGERPAKVVDAHTGQPEEQGQKVAVSPTGLDRLTQGAGLQSPGSFPPPNERDLMVLADKLDGGSVEIYDLNSATPRTYGGSVEAKGGMPYAMDTSVSVFPVEGDSVYPGQLSPGWPNSVLPMNAAEPMAMGSISSGGRISTHVGSGYSPTQIFFAHGSSRLGGGDRDAIRQAAEQAKFSPVERISVEGHASKTTQISDPVESKIVNLKQSMNRAFNVSSQLMRDGVPAEKIKTTVWGDTNNTGGPEAENRRVDIVTGSK